MPESQIWEQLSLPSQPCEALCFAPRLACYFSAIILDMLLAYILPVKNRFTVKFIRR